MGVIHLGLAMDHMPLFIIDRSHGTFNERWPDSYNWATAPALEELEDGLGGWGVEV